MNKIITILVLLALSIWFFYPDHQAITEPSLIENGGRYYLSSTLFTGEQKIIAGYNTTVIRTYVDGFLARERTFTGSILTMNMDYENNLDTMYYSSGKKRYERQNLSSLVFVVKEWDDLGNTISTKRCDGLTCIEMP